MKINYLEIKGFKSIQNVELKDVSPFMVLAGANGTGKSNFVDALAFLSKVIDMGVSKAVSEFGGVNNLIDPKQENEIISYRINVEIEEKVYEYEIDILLSKSSLLPSLPTVPVSVKHEYLKIFKNGKTIFDSSEEARKLELKKKEDLRAAMMKKFDQAVPHLEKIDALLMKLGGEFLVGKDDRVYIFEKDGVTAKFDAKHARDFSFKDYLCKDMNKLFHDF